MAQRGGIGAYVTVVVAAGVLTIVALARDGAAALAAGGPALWLLAALVVPGELQPLRLRTRGGVIVATTATTFTFAVLLVGSVGAAVVAQAVASLVADLRARLPLWKATFNAVQYALSVAAAGAVLTLLPPSGPPSAVDLGLADVPALLTAGSVLLLVNYGLTGVAFALAMQQPLWTTLRRDFGSNVAMTATLLLFAPVLAVIAVHALVLIPLLLLVVVMLQRSATTSMEREHAAMHDPLTELGNRRLLETRLSEALETRDPDDSVALLVIDLDRFKPVNDAFGHQIGDHVLRQVARRLAAAVPDADTVARIGGDEFAVIATGLAGVADAEEVAARVLRAFEQPYFVDGYPLDLGASVGVALSPHHGSTWRELVEGGDVAMYAAKSAGGGFEVFTPVRDAEGRGRVELLAQLREAIDDDQLVVHWQPIAAIESAGVEAAEALVRWEHPRHGLVYPDEFVPLAEQTELIGALTLRVLDRALEQCRRWHADGLRLRVSVNLSVHNLLDPEFPAQVSRLLRRWHVAPEWLKFEITEHTVMTDPIAAGRTLQELSAMGVRLAIDDFGTGYSSLVHLQQLPVDEIKIDKSFILGLGTAPGPGVTGIAPDGPLLPALIGFARRLGLRIVAEGVETPEAWDRLAVYGCDFAQGYYLSRPAAGPEFTRWLQRRLAESPSPSGAPVLRVVDGSGDDEPVAPQRRAAGA